MSTLDDGSSDLRLTAAQNALRHTASVNADQSSGERLLVNPAADEEMAEQSSPIFVEDGQRLCVVRLLSDFAW